VHWKGNKITKLNKAFRNSVRDAGLGKEFTPHCTRHTAATWMMLKGLKLYDAANVLGMTVKVLEEIYGHHHPDYQAEFRELY